MKKFLNLCLAVASVMLISGFQSSAQATVVLDQVSTSQGFGSIGYGFENLEFA